VSTFLAAVAWLFGVGAVWLIGMAIIRFARRMRRRGASGRWGEPPAIVWIWSGLLTFMGIAGLIVIVT
jgi:hypothetical protein